MDKTKTEATPNQSRKSEEEENDVIGDLMGHYGKYQFMMTMLLTLFQVPNTFHIAAPIYQVSQ